MPATVWARYFEAEEVIEHAAQACGGSAHS